MNESAALPIERANGKQHRMLVISVGCLYSTVVSRSWQSFQFDNAKVDLMTLSLTVIIVGSLITVARRLKRISQGLR